MTPHDIADPALAGQGARRIAWAERAMPVLGLLRERFAKDQPLTGLTVAACMHVTTETAALVRTLVAAGASLHLAASNPLSTQDDVAAALVEEGVAVFARHGVDRAGHEQHLKQVLASQARPAARRRLRPGLAGRREDRRKRIRGGIEETTTGVLRLRQMAGEGALRFPMVAVNDTAVQRLVANRHGTGQSTMDAVLRATGVLLAGTTVVVSGYGPCGAGIAERARGLGALVVVTEVDAGPRPGGRPRRAPRACR